MTHLVWKIFLLFVLLLSAGLSMAADPIASPQSVTVTTNSSIDIYLQGTDADNDALTYGILSSPAAGTLTIPPVGNKVTYTAPAQTGTYTFTFWIVDATGDESTSATVTITVTEDDFLLTFVTATLIPIIKQKQDQELQDYINSLTLTDATIRSCFPGSVPQGSTLYNWTTLTCEGKDLSAPSAMADLGKLVNLQTLELRYSKLADISALSNLTKLKRLDLEFNELGSAAALSRMTDLEYLNLGFNELTDISFLSGMNKLKELHLDANQIGDISVLNGKTTLLKLSLDDNQITSTTPLVNLTGLTHLGLGYNRRLADNISISDISPLNNLRALQTLVLDGNDITAHATTGTGALVNLSLLEQLYLRGNDISAPNSNDLFPSGHTLLNLRTLELGFNEIKDISPLASMINLTRLGLEYNQIEDSSILYGRTGLQHLTLDYNKIRQTGNGGSGLHTLTGLNSYLDLRGNLLLDITPLTNMTNGFTLLADDNCLGSIVVPSNSTIKTFGKDWQFPPYPRCNVANQNDKPLAYAQQVSLYQGISKNITLAGADPDGNADTITYAIVSGPTYGTIQSFSAGAGTFTYVPNTNYTGIDNITFSVTDSASQTSQASVQITVLPTSLISDPALQSCFTNGVPSNSTLQNLTEFSCNGTNLSGADLSQLGNLTSLTQVALLNANLTDISGLNNIGTNWTFLDLRYNNITNVSNALANKGNVAILGLDGNQITNISVLSGMTKLTAVYADGNDIVGSGLPSLNSLTHLALLTLRQSRLKTADLQSAWGSAILETDLVIHLDQNCLVSKPVLPAKITIQPVDAAGAITQQRPLSGTECPAL